MPMISGKISIIDSKQSDITGFKTVSPSGADLNKYVNIENEFTLNSGRQVKEGLAVEEYPYEREKVDVNGDINVGKEEVTRKRWTRYWILNDEFVIVKNADGKFAFKLIEQAISGDVSEAEFNLGRIVSDHPGQWMGQFEERSDNVRNGTLYGDDIEHDQDIGTAFRNSDKNMIGPDIDYGGQTLRLRMGENWFQVLRPGNFTRREYLNFLDEYLRQYV